jgi:hypothetical protein
MKISIDKLTFCGNSLGDIETHIGNEVTLERQSFAKYPYRKALHYQDGSVLQIGEIDAVRSGKIKELRYEFNPNKMKYEDLHIRVMSMLKDAHATRVDVAFDVFDVDMSRWKWIDSQSRRSNVYYGPNGEVETWYVGGKDSALRIRIYNKALEQKIKDKVWWRVEVQMRRDIADLFVAMKGQVDINPFETVTPVVNGNFPELDIKRRAMVNYLIEHPSGFSELSPTSRSEYKKLLRMIGSWECIDFFHIWNKKISDVHSEILTWLNFTKTL